MTVNAKYTEVIPVPPKMPSIVQRAVNLARSLPPLIQTNFAKVPDDIRAARLATCLPCEYWSAEAYRGAGGCTHDKCGCSVGKVNFVGSECPIGRWGKYVAEPVESSAISKPI